MVGPRGGGSKDPHRVVKTIAETKVANKARSLGRELSDKELGIVVTQVRKYLSTSFIRAQGLCLLNRLCFLGGSQGGSGEEGPSKKVGGGQKEGKAYTLHGSC